VTAGKDGSARIWTLGKGKPDLRLSSPGGPVFRAAFSPDGRTVVTADEDGEIRIWDAKSGKQLTLLNAHEGVIFSAAFATTGTKIVTADAAGDAAVWTTELAGSRNDVERIAAERVTRELTPQERKSYLPD
jgi:WD40 repeat protein